MQSTYQQLQTQYETLRELIFDVDAYLKKPEHYTLFDPVVQKAILEPDQQNPAAFDANALPQVKLIKDLRENIGIIANDFRDSNYTKFLKALYHLQNFRIVLKSFLLSESTINFSPEFNNKMLSVISFLVQWQQIFYDELTIISNKSQIVLKNAQDFSFKIDTKQLHYYHQKLIALLKVIPDDQKIKPYIKNLEKLVVFIINLKEKGVLGSNLIGSLLDLFDSFDNLTRTSIKEILQEYAIFTEKEINELLDQINDFWNSFFPVCDELETNLGLKMGYLTERLKPAIHFFNVIDAEFAPALNDEHYPFKNKRLAKIQYSINQTKELLTEEKRRYNQLNELEKLVQNFLTNKQFDLEKVVTAHQSIELLTCDASLKKEFHSLLDKQIELLPKDQLTESQLASLELNQLRNKYQLHQASLEEAKQLIEAIAQSNYDEEKQRYLTEMKEEYQKSKDQLKEILEKIAAGLISDDDIKHLIVMINLFEPLQAEVNQKLTLIHSALENQIKNLENLQHLLDLFESSRLPEEDFYPLLYAIDLLDCDRSIKEKYKELITDVDYKRKNGGYLSLATDFIRGFFAPVIVPFSEIHELIQNKVTRLKTVINENSSQSKDLPPAKTEAKTINLIEDLLSPFGFIARKKQWNQLKEKINTDKDESKIRLTALQNIQAFKEDRYRQLEKSFADYRPPVVPLSVSDGPPKRTLPAWRNTLNNLFKIFTARTLSFAHSVYIASKKAFAYIKSFFFPNKNVTDTSDIEITRREEPPVKEPYPYQEVDPKLPLAYKQLSFLEERIFWFSIRTVHPQYHAALKNALKKHQSIKITKDMPYFYEQSAKIINAFILFRKVLLSYSHLDMLHLNLAIADLNAENKIIFKNILENSNLKETSHLYQTIIKPSFANFYQTLNNLKEGTDLTTSLPEVAHKFHHTIESTAHGEPIDVKPFMEFLKRVETNSQKQGNQPNKDLKTIYHSIDKLTEFLEKVVNNKQNLLVEFLFSLNELSHHFRQLSSSVTRLLIEDQFPYVKELGQVMLKLNTILTSLQTDIDKLEAAGLNPTLLDTLRNCTTVSEYVTGLLTPLKFQQERILLDVEKIKSSLLVSKFPSNRGLKNELENVILLLTKETDKKFINKELLDRIETRLNEIKLQINKLPFKNMFSLFPQSTCSKAQEENIPSIITSRSSKLI